MCALSHQISEMASWWEEVKYEAIVTRWRKETLAREEGGGLEEPSRMLTLTMVKSRYLRTTATPSLLLDT